MRERYMRLLNTEPIFPGNGQPPRTGEDRPGLSPFARLAMGGCYGKSTILIYDHCNPQVQNAQGDMIMLEGDDVDACQLSLTLYPPRVVPIAICELPLDVNNVTGEQGNGEISVCDFPGTDESIRWPPLEAVVEFGVGGVSTRVVVDYMNGVTLSVIASYLRVSALVTQSSDCGDIVGTSALYRLAAHVGPGFAEAHAQRTIFLGEVDDNEDSKVLNVPDFAKVATLAGCRAGKQHHHKPKPTIGWIRFWQDPKGRHCVGDFFMSDHQDRVEVPNAAQYFSVFNESGHKMKMSVIFELGL
jgi:hypothetical protein